MDKITVYPPHAFCRGDIRMILSSIPLTWAENIRVVRLSAARASAVALYSRPDKTLTIASRGYAKEVALHRVLSEIAAHTLGFKLRTFQHLQARYEADVETLVAPLVAELLPKLSEKKVWLDKPAD